MLNYARQRAIEQITGVDEVTLVTQGPAGLQATQVACRLEGLVIHLLVPRTSDHLFNLAQAGEVILVGPGWELSGQACIETQPDLGPEQPAAPWHTLVRVEPGRLHIHAGQGWGNVETIDLSEK